jgi:Beta-lactamase superfamily domain
VHPGPTIGYRIEHGGKVVTYLPDHEPALCGAIEERPLDWLSGGSLADGADLLFHDGQFSVEEYETRIGWGHSSVADEVEYGKAVGAKRLVVFHHDPAHDDDLLDLEAVEARAIAYADGGGPTLAREGMVLELR